MNLFRDISCSINWLLAVSLLIGGTVVTAHPCICAAVAGEKDPPCYGSIATFLAGENANGTMSSDCPFRSVAGSREMVVNSGGGSSYRINVSTDTTVASVTFDMDRVSLSSTSVTFVSVNLVSTAATGTTFIMAPHNGSQGKSAELKIQGTGETFIDNVAFHMTTAAVWHLEIISMKFKGSGRVVMDAAVSTFTCTKCFFTHRNSTIRTNSFVNIGDKALGTTVVLNKCIFRREAEEDFNSFMAHPYVDGFSCANTIELKQSWLSINGNKGHLVDLKPCSKKTKAISVVKFSGVKFVNVDPATTPLLNTGLLRVQGNIFGPKVEIGDTLTEEIRGNSIGGKVYLFDVEQSQRGSPQTGGFGFRVTSAPSDTNRTDTPVKLATFNCLRSGSLERSFKAFVEGALQLSPRVVVGCQNIFSELNEDIPARVAFPFQMMEPLRARHQNHMWSVWNKESLIPSQERFYRNGGSQSWDNFSKDVIKGAKLILKQSSSTVRMTEPRTFIVSTNSEESVANYLGQFNYSYSGLLATRYIRSQTFKKAISPENILTLINSPKTAACSQVLTKEALSHLAAFSKSQFCVENYLDEEVPFYIHNGKTTNFGGDSKSSGQVFIALGSVGNKRDKTPQLLYYDPDNVQSRYLAILYLPPKSSSSSISFAASLLTAFGGFAMSAFIFYA